MSRHLFAKLTAFVAVVAVASVAALATASNALAWTYALSGMANCNDQTGNYDVVWTINNSGENEPFTVTYSNRAAVPKGSVVAAGGSQDFPETLPGTTAGTTALSINGNWPSDTGSHPMGTYVSTNGMCKKSSPPPCKSQWGSGGSGSGKSCTPPPCQPDNSGKDKDHGWGKGKDHGGDNCQPTPPTPPSTPPPPPPCSVDLQAVKSADKPAYMVGDAVSYTIDVNNVIGDYCTSKGSVLTDTFPAQFAYQTFTVSDSSVGCSVVNNVLTCKIGELAPLAHGGQDVKVMVSGQWTASSTSPITNTTCVQPTQESQQPDSNEGNNCGSSIVMVNAPPAATTPPVTTPPAAPAPKPAPKPHKPVVKHHPKPKPPVVKHHPKPKPKKPNVHKPAKPKYTP